MLFLTIVLLLTALVGVVTYQREGNPEFLTLSGMALVLIPIVWWIGL